MKRLYIFLGVYMMVGILHLHADVRMPLIFGNHMVLQQDSELAIWGWADNDEKVSVSFAGQKATTVADKEGKWTVHLNPVKEQKEGGTLIVSGNNTLTFTDVLVGDVWVASGQSNMEWGLNLKKEYAADVEQSTDSLLRLFFVPRNTSLEPLANIEKPKDTQNPKLAARWIICNPKSLLEINGQGFSAVAYYFARDLRTTRKSPLGIIQSAWGGTRAEAWTSIVGLKQEPLLKHYVDRYEQNVKNNPGIIANYEQRKKEHEIAIRKWNKEQSGTKRPSDPPKPNGGNNGPTNLFNAMISPLIPLSIKGVIWYQGEFNSGGSGKEYATLFLRMIKDWRGHWGIGDFPFVFVQLPNFGPIDQEPSAEGEGWRWVREGQLKALNLPNTTMATTIDVGDVVELHPIDKYDVGHRLSLAARKLAYGEKIVGMGPIYKNMKVEGDKIVVEFTNQGKKLMLGVSPYHPKGQQPKEKPKQLTGFGIAGSDRKFYWADAVIKGNKVVVSSKEVHEPVAVRYGFSNSPQCNLYNEAGLPTSPFRTDSWDK